MRPNRLKHDRRRRREFRFRPRGFSERHTGPIWRGILTLLGISREHRRPAYNVLAIYLLLVTSFCIGIMSLVNGGPCAGIGGLISGLVVGWTAITIFRFFR